MKPASAYAAFIVRKLWATSAIILVVVAVALSILRFSLPYMDSQKYLLQDYLVNEYGLELDIGQISATWSGSGPAIVLQQLRLHQNSQSPIALNIAEAQIDLDFWASISARQFQSQRFVLNGLELTVDVNQIQTADGDFLIVEALESLFLEQLQRFSVANSQITLLTAKSEQVIQIEQLSWANQDRHHQGVGQLRVKELTNNSASFTLDLYGSKRNLKGTFFAKGEELDLSPWLNQLVRSDEVLSESRGNFTFWAGIENSKLTSIQMELADSRFSWQGEDSQISTIIQGGNFRAAPDANGWAFNLDNLTLQTTQQKSWVTNWAGHLDKDGGLNVFSLQPFILEPLRPVLPLFLDEKAGQTLADLAPQAKIDHLGFSYNDQRIAAYLSFSDFSFQQLGKIPGAQDLTGELNWFGQQGQLFINGQNDQLITNNLLDDNIAYQQLTANLYIRNEKNGFVLDIPELSFTSEDLTFTQALHYSSQINELSLVTQIDPLEVDKVKTLFPGELMGTETRSYLDRAIQAGHVLGAQLLWHGSPQNFPFENDSGIFQAAVQLGDATFSFDTHWPSLTELDIDLLFENEGLLMTSSKARLADIQVSQLSALIPKLSHGAVLSIDGIADGSGTEVSHLMQASMLADSVGSVLKQVQVKDQLQANLHLVIPLTGKNVVAQGKVDFAGNSISIPALDLNFANTQGSLTFNNEVIEISNVETELLGQPVTVNMSGYNAEAGYQVDIDLAGEWQITPLLEASIPGFTEYMSGHSNWTAKLDLSLPEQGYQYNFQLNSDLHNLSSRLPGPFQKSAQQIMPLQAVSTGNQQASNITIALGDDIKFTGVLPHQEKQFSRAHLGIGHEDVVTMGLGFSISAQAEKLDFSAWYAAIHSLVAGLPSGKDVILSEPQRIYLEADSVLVAGQYIDDVQLVAKHSDQDWQLELNAKQARAKIKLYKDWLAKGVEINADYINLEQWQESSEALASKPKFSTIPPVKFSCSQCRFQDKNLGKLDLELSRSSRAMRIENLRINSPNGILNATGDWYVDDLASSTRLQGDFNSSDIGALLKGFGFESGVKDSKASFEFDLSWQNAPYEFNFQSLNGDIDWRLTDGYLTEVSDKGSRIFSILSLESLVRKLRLDFRDVFAKGFFYDKMKGSFQLSDGLADTRDTVIDGGAGEMTIQGYTDLPSQQLNYKIAFTPKVTSSLPVIVAWMVNPATALAALALDQVLTSAKVISNIEYSLTGSIDDPVLTELGRDSKDISLPAKVPTPTLPQQPSSSYQTPPIQPDLSARRVNG